MKRIVIAAAVASLFAGVAQARTTELVIYQGPNFHGPSKVIKGEVANLEDFNNNISSMIARGGAWQVCTGDHFSGRCRVIREGEHPRLGWLNDRITAVRFLGDNPDLARYDNWDTYGKRAEADARDWRDERRDNARDAWRDREAAQQSYRYGDREPQQTSRYGDDDRRWK
jgi:hypothetical protein